jgi:hypothetical protein
VPLTRRFLFWPSLLVPVAALMATSSGRPAHAFDKRTCAAAYESGQLLRHQQRLRKAREQLAICAHSTCPSVVTQDCASWLKEVDASIPTLFFRVRDERGRAVSDFRVLVDGEPVARETDAPFPLDPGPHLVRIEAEGLAPLEQNIVLKPGERARLVESTLLLTRRDVSETDPVERAREPSKIEARIVERSPAEKTGVEKPSHAKLVP